MTGKGDPPFFSEIDYVLLIKRVNKRLRVGRLSPLWVYIGVARSAARSRHEILWIYELSVVGSCVTRREGLVFSKIKVVRLDDQIVVRRGFFRGRAFAAKEKNRCQEAKENEYRKYRWSPAN